METIDLSYLEEVTNGDREVMLEMIDLLIEESPKHIEKIKEHFANENWSALGSTAHTLKPMLLYVGLAGLSDTAKSIEFCGKNIEDIETLPSLIEKLDAEFTVHLSDLKDKKEKLT